MRLSVVCFAKLPAIRAPVFDLVHGLLIPSIPVLFESTLFAPVHLHVIRRKVIHVMIPPAAFANAQLPTAVRFIDSKPRLRIAWNPARWPLNFHPPPDTQRPFCDGKKRTLSFDFFGPAKTHIEIRIEGLHVSIRDTQPP